MNEFFADVDGERVDVFITKKLAGFSRSHIQRLISSGKVTIYGKKARAGLRLSAGDAVSVEIPQPEPDSTVPEDIPLDVLYEDDDVIVINKARGMTVHPAPGARHGTLVNALLARSTSLSGINGKIRPGIVHRLDKDTSGVMMAAKNDAAHISLASQIQRKEASRVYLAIAVGVITENEGIIKAPIGRSPKDRKKMAVVPDGREAVTRFRVLERFGRFTLVECRLMTGRTHQIRVHMAYIGHPLLSDPKYGRHDDDFMIFGQALHSSSLSFVHPRTGEAMEFSAPLPEDMRAILAKLRAQKG